VHSWLVPPFHFMGVETRSDGTFRYEACKRKERQEIMDSSSAINSASSIQMDYMKLLITQLQNQNPLEPLNNNEMASQLAQFSQLQQLESMNTSFASVLTATERTYANSLIGKEVSFPAVTDAGTQETTSGAVEEVQYNADGGIFLTVGDHQVALEDIVSVKN
jgi:flagellar basal-body rod modification protein FlgD